MGGLHEAIKSLDISKVKSILQSGVGMTPLMNAATWNIKLK